MMKKTLVNLLIFIIFMTRGSIGSVFCKSCALKRYKNGKTSVTRKGRKRV